MNSNNTLAAIRQQMTDMERQVERMMMALNDSGATDSKSEGHTAEVVMEMNSLMNHMADVRRTLFDAQA